MGWARAQGTTGISGFAAPQGEGHGFDPAQGCEGMWLPTYLGSLLAAWYKADAGCYTDAACLFASASSQYLSKTSPTFAPTTKMTIAFDYKPTTTALFCLVSRREAGQAQFVVYALGTGLLRVRICLDGNDTVDTRFDATATTFSAGTNYRIVIVYDGTQAAADRLKVYIDGVLEAGTITGTMPTSLIASTSALQVGSDANGTFCNGYIARLGFSSLALSGAALTAAHTSTFWADMTAARQADWFSFYNLCEASSTRVDSTGLNNLTPTNGPTVAAGPGEGLATNNSPVKRWEDQSGNARHLVQATIAAQPLWIASGQNGRPVVRADGTDDRVAYSPLTLAQPLTWHGAFKYAAAGASGTMLYGTNNATPAVYQGANQFRMYATTEVNNGADDALWHAHICQFSGASSAYYIDAGASSLSGDPGSFDFSAESVSLFAAPDNVLPSAGDIGECYLVGAASTATNRASSFAYIKSRWATP